MKTLTTEHIVATVHANPYEPGAEVHIEAKHATRSEIEDLQGWIDQYLESLYILDMALADEDDTTRAHEELGK